MHRGGEKISKGKDAHWDLFHYVQAIPWKNNVFISLEFSWFHITIDKLWPSKYYSNGLKKLGAYSLWVEEAENASCRRQA